jgi:transposase
MVTDIEGRPYVLMLTKGQRADIKMAKPCLERLLTAASRIIADRGYDSDELRQTLRDNGIEAVIPPRKNRKVQYAYDREIYKLRNVIERTFGRLKDWKALSLRTYRCADTFLSAACIAATILWWVK